MYTLVITLLESFHLKWNAAGVTLVTIGPYLHSLDIRFSVENPGGGGNSIVSGFGTLICCCLGLVEGGGGGGGSSGDEDRDEEEEDECEDFSFSKFFFCV